MRNGLSNYLSTMKLYMYFNVLRHLFMTLFIKNFAITIKVCLFLFLLTILIGLTFMLILTGISVPVSALLSLFMYLNSVSGFLIVMSVATIILTLTFLVIGSIFSAYQLCFWVLLFLEIFEKNILNKK